MKPVDPWSLRPGDEVVVTDRSEKPETVVQVDTEFGYIHTNRGLYVADAPGRTWERLFEGDVFRPPEPIAPAPGTIQAQMAEILRRLDELAGR